jgi:hypothetical protein
MSILQGYLFALPSKATMQLSSPMGKPAQARPIRWKDSNIASLIKIEASFQELFKISSLILKLEAKIKRSLSW